MTEKLKIERFEKDILKRKIADYFLECESKNPKEAYTISGLAFSLSVPKKDISKYPETGKFFDLIEHTKQKIENQLIQMLLTKKIDKSVANLILINDFGYKNQSSKQEEKKEDKLKTIKKSISDVLNEIENG
jgi:hypothetical protein